MLKLHARQLLWSLILLCATTAANATEPLRAVLLSSFDVNITRHRFAPMANLLEELSRQAVIIRPLSQFSDVESSIRRGEADVVFLAANRGRQLAAEHDYRIIAQTFQPVHLYVLRNHISAPFQKFIRIGVINNTLAKEVAMREMPQLSEYATFTPLPNHSAALMALLKGQVDAIVANPSPVSGVMKGISQKIAARHSFGNVGSSVVAVAPQLADSQLTLELQQLLLANGEQVRALQENFGLGSYQLPRDNNLQIAEDRQHTE